MQQIVEIANVEDNSSNFSDELSDEITSTSTWEDDSTSAAAPSFLILRMIFRSQIFDFVDWLAISIAYRLQCRRSRTSATSPPRAPQRTALKNEQVLCCLRLQTNIVAGFTF